MSGYRWICQDRINTEAMGHRILLIDDHPAMVRGVQEIVSEARKDVEFGTAGNADEALAKARASGWDMAVVDLGIPGAVGFKLIQALKNTRPGMRILVYSMHPEEQLGGRALQAGADGYLPKGAPPGEVLRAVTRVLEGRRYVSDKLTAILATRIAQPAERELSEREDQVLRRIAQGYGLTEIGNELGLSVKTVGTYRLRILEKLNLESTADLVRYAVENGLVE
jgi:DNA-binding NarL/FixJ family response regulator